ncbi:MAG: BLUF domain-containing protein [Allosphingosinicella sp.]|uniref:BLUF domain-containing protein n=1 Tax=Allosphingosinicella sp. TaxID=2823234 RepID=UPI00394C76A5
MLQLVYISTARERPTDAMLQDILAVSRRNNQKVGVTGLLVAGGRRFLQALEGPSTAVSATFDRIRADPRHYAPVVLSCRSVAGRSFGEWAMGYEQGGQPIDGADLRQIVAELTSPIFDKGLHAEFNGFAELHARAA